MGINDLAAQAKSALADHGDKISGGLDNAAEFVKSKTSDDVDTKIDSAVDSAQGFIAKQQQA